jgi:hypothetical protein
MKASREHTFPASREITQEGKVILHSRCTACGRDFAKEEGDQFWRAAHAGPFRLQILAEDVNEKWIVEGCPGKLYSKVDGHRRGAP